MKIDGLQQSIHITTVTEQYEEAARQLILDGLEERFGFLDSSLNPDLAAIIRSYSEDGGVFLVGIYNHAVVCTGALTREQAAVGRIQRMSVKKSCRRAGLAKLMIQALEERARRQGYKEIVLETNNEWHSAIEFYKSKGYQLDCQDKQQSHFLKRLS